MVWNYTGLKLVEATFISLSSLRITGKNYHTCLKKICTFSDKDFSPIITKTMASALSLKKGPIGHVEVWREMRWWGMNQSSSSMCKNLRSPISWQVSWHHGEWVFWLLRTTVIRVHGCTEELWSLGLPRSLQPICGSTYSAVQGQATKLNCLIQK